MILTSLQRLFRQLYSRPESRIISQRSKAWPSVTSPYLELPFSSGMRVLEISNLRVAMVDLERRAVLVRGKGNKERLLFRETIRACVNGGPFFAWSDLARHLPQGV